MRQEIHVHGYLELVEGVSKRQVEVALRPLLDYLDVERLDELQSLEPDQPGFVYSQRNFALEMCCTLEVGRHFLQAMESAMQAIGKFVETAAPIEIISYRDDGQDEVQMLFVGPTPAAILDAQRRHMLNDVSALLSRHFRQEAVDEVLTLVSDLFRREQPVNAITGDDETASSASEVPGRHRLH